MFEELIHQFHARIFQLFFGRVRVAWQQRLRLDVNQRRRHHQELAGHGDVQLAHRGQVFEVLRRDARDGNVVDGHLFFANEVEQQVERPFKIGQLDFVLV